MHGGWLRELNNLKGDKEMEFMGNLHGENYTAMLHVFPNSYYSGFWPKAIIRQLKCHIYAIRLKTARYRIKLNNLCKSF